MMCAGKLLAYALPAHPGDKPAPPIRLPHGHMRSVFSVSFGQPLPQLPSEQEEEPLRVMTTGMDRAVRRWAVPMTPMGPDWKAAKVRDRHVSVQQTFSAQRAAQLPSQTVLLHPQVSACT